MQQILVGGTNNVYTYTFTVAGTNGTLVISGVEGFDLVPASLNSIWDTTASKSIATGANTCTLSRVAGQPVWTFVIPYLPTGVATSDTLSITLNIPDCVSLLPQLQYSGSKV